MKPIQSNSVQLCRVANPESCTHRKVTDQNVCKGKWSIRNTAAAALRVLSISLQVMQNHIRTTLLVQDQCLLFSRNIEHGKSPKIFPTIKMIDWAIKFINKHLKVLKIITHTWEICEMRKISRLRRQTTFIRSN